ncbi:hypothetical protein M0805_002641 [Coniferiporia weirii]|nr:hypothetical protein M0805_002641 [Coniferiporia weirii]
MPTRSILRPAVLFLSFAFGTIAFGVGINALVKSNKLKSFVKKNAPAGATVDIDTHDIFSAGAVVTAVSGLIGLSSFLALVLTSSFSRLRASPKSSGAARALAYTHAFLAVWLFAALVPFSDFARNRQAGITASIGGQTLPPAFVQQQEQQLGVSPVYWEQRYIRLVTIIPWFTILFGALASAVLFRTSGSGSGSGAGAGTSAASTGAVTERFATPPPPSAGAEKERERESTEEGVRGRGEKV